MPTGVRNVAEARPRYYTYAAYLRRQYGEKVYKLPVNLPVTCPNRDGTVGVGGCAWCGAQGAGFEDLPATVPVAEQLRRNREYISRRYGARKFIAYFQNFTNTYLPPSRLAAYLDAACQPQVVELAVSTRPDCVSEAHLEAMAQTGQRRGVNISVELGLQTANYHTLRRLNRGHTLGEFIDATLRVKRRGFAVCAHVILNLPGDDGTDVVETAKVLSALGVDQVKLHALYIVAGTALAEQYRRGELTLISQDEYVDRAVTFLRYLRPEAAVQRLVGRAPAADTLFVNWHHSWWTIQDAIMARLEAMDAHQGDKCTYLDGAAVRRCRGGQGVEDAAEAKSKDE